MKKLKMNFLSLIKLKSWKTLKKELHKLEPLQVAELIENMEKTDGIVLFRLLSRKLAKETFQHLSHEQQEDIVKNLVTNTDQITNLLNDLNPDDRTAFFEELPGEISWRLVQLLSFEEHAVATCLLGYPDESIGRLMTPEYVAIEPNYTVQQALEHIRRFGKDSETLNVIYIIDDHRRLIDDIRIKELILASPDETIANLTDNRFISLNAYADQEMAIQVFQNYDRVALPVTDTDGTLLGIVTIDDVMDVAQEESTEDFHKFGGIKELNLSYTKTSLFELVKKRAGWLTALFFSEMLTTNAMSYFDVEISKAVVLALFVPLIISSGGNSGSQAASLIIRSLALEELRLKNWWYVMKKEILSGLLLGFILGSIGFFRIFLWQEIGFYNYGIYWFWIGLSVSISLIFVVLWGTISGSMIPFILKQFGLDPATASAPFVATLVDVTGLIIYFSVALILLKNKLL